MRPAATVSESASAAVLRFDRMRYVPNPAHKRETTEAGSGSLRLGKTRCPQMTVQQRNELLANSIPEDPNDPDSRRFALQRTLDSVEFYAAVVTQRTEGGPEFHGFPVASVPGKVLKSFRDRGDLTRAEYNKFRKVLG